MKRTGILKGLKADFFICINVAMKQVFFLPYCDTSATTSQTRQNVGCQ